MSEAESPRGFPYWSIPAHPLVDGSNHVAHHMLVFAGGLSFHVLETTHHELISGIAIHEGQSSMDGICPSGRTHQQAPLYSVCVSCSAVVQYGRYTHVTERSQVCYIQV